MKKTTNMQEVTDKLYSIKLDRVLLNMHELNSQLKWRN